jgi:hypothetical protein
MSPAYNDEDDTMPAKEVIETLGIDADDYQFGRFAHWTFEQQLRKEIPLYITDLDGKIHQFEFYWYQGGRHFTMEKVVFPSFSAKEAANAPDPTIVFALEDIEGNSQAVTPLGSIELSDKLGWALFWALEEQKYWIVFNWEEPEDSEYVEDPWQRQGIFYPTDHSFSYCRLSGFNFDNWSGKMESLYAGGFIARQLTRKNGVLIPLHEGVPAPAKEFF